MKRKSFIYKSFLGTIGVGLVTGIYSWQIEPFWIEFVKLNMPINYLPVGLEGKTLMQISDIHIGNKFDHQYIIDSFREASKYKPDIVVYTVDFVSYGNEEQFSQLKEVLKYAIKGDLMTITILGNHDYGRNWG